MRNYKILLNTIEVEKDKHFTDLYQVSFDMLEKDNNGIDEYYLNRYSRPVFAENENAAIAKVFFELRDDIDETYSLTYCKDK